MLSKITNINSSRVHDGGGYVRGGTGNRGSNTNLLDSYTGNNKRRLLLSNRFFVTVVLPAQCENNTIKMRREVAPWHISAIMSACLSFLNKLTLPCPSCAPVLNHLRSRWSRPGLVMSGDAAGRQRWQQPARSTTAAVMGKGSEARLPGRSCDAIADGVATALVASTDVVARTTTRMSREMPRAWNEGKYVIFYCCVLLSHAILTPFPYPSHLPPSLKLRRSWIIKPVGYRV